MGSVGRGIGSVAACDRGLCRFDRGFSSAICRLDGGEETAFDDAVGLGCDFAIFEA